MDVEFFMVVFVGGGGCTCESASCDFLGKDLEVVCCIGIDPRNSDGADGASELMNDVLDEGLEVVSFVGCFVVYLLGAGGHS